MIIFFNKKTGQIIGTIDGRVHDETQLNVWIGDKNETDKIVVNWKEIGQYEKPIELPVFEEYVDKDGFTKTRQVGIKKVKEVYHIYEPDHPQKDLFIEIDKKPISIYDYKVDTKTKLLVKK
jgi:hypothetical protein